jgi:hypothetical protein
MFQNLPLRDNSTYIRKMNVYIMYVEISYVCCKNHAERQVECEDKVMNISMLKQVVCTHTHTHTHTYTHTHTHIYIYIYTVTLGV